MIKSPIKTIKEAITIHIILDNIRSAYNVGAFLRTADSIGHCHIYTCGYTPEAGHPKVHKTALGAEESVPHSKVANATDIIQTLRDRQIPIFAVELTEDSIPFHHVTYPHELALVFGNEIDGVSPEILSLADQTVSIPMLGMKKSLNVATAGGILLAEVAKQHIYDAKAVC